LICAYLNTCFQLFLANHLFLYVLNIPGKF
jgi:hypothetical protein